MSASKTLSAVTALSILSLAAAQSCPLKFDGRVPTGTVATDFDTDNGLYNPDYVRAANVTWGKSLLLPDVEGSLFDTASTVPLEVTVSDNSIYNTQVGFRRAELLPSSNNGTDGSGTGIKTLHFSLMKDTARPLNYSHEYQLVFLEDNTYSTNQFVLKTGTIVGVDTPDPETLQVFGNVTPWPGVQLFSTAFTEGVFHNFAITLDFTKNTTQVYYSTGSEALTAQTEAVANDVSGQGQFHFGVLKKSTDAGADSTKSGFQEAGISEGIIFGGIFQEDSSSGCISLSPASTTSSASSSSSNTTTTPVSSGSNSTTAASSGKSCKRGKRALSYKA